MNLVVQYGPISFGSLASSVSTASLILNTPLTVGGNGVSTVFTSVISGAGSLSTVGPSTFTLNSANTYTGGTNVNGGLLILKTGGSLPANAAVTVNSTGVLRMGIASALPSTTALTVNTGGDFQLGGYATTINSLNGVGTVEDASSTAVTLTVATGTTTGTFSGLFQNGTGNGALTLAVTGTGSLLFGTPTLNLTGGITIASGATLGFAGSGNLTTGVGITGAGALAVEGGGTLTLSSGDTVSVGSLLIGDNAGGTAGAGTFDIGSGVTFTDTGALSLGAASGAPGKINETGGKATFSSATSSALVIGSTATGTYNLSGGTFAAASSTLLVGSNGTGQFNISGSGAAATVVGLNMTPATGATSNIDITAGELTVSASGITGTSSASITLGGGTLQFGASITDPVTTILSTGTTSTIDTQSYTDTLSGQITGGGA